MKSVKPKKFLGQHFLNDINVVDKIINLINREEKYILELGPGTGALTQHIINTSYCAKFIEIDNESVVYLKKKFPEIKNKIIEADFLKFDVNKIYKFPFTLLGNFPYNISSQILFKVLDNKNKITKVIGMFQKEVAERIVAKKGKKKGILSVLTQAFYDVEYCFSVGNEKFYPPPKVDSAVIRLQRNERANLECDEKLFKHIVKKAFNQRRKTLKNALKSFNLSESKEINKLLFLRAEELSVKDFILITLNVRKNNK
jgi:16S rRNA (adenine1518-N6/adenine1519-N6)-dimethyltransferase